MSIGERIREVRHDHSLTVREFAEALSIEDKTIDRGNLSRYENDLVKPSFDFFYCICKVFSVNLNWLIVDIGSMYLVREKKRLTKSKEKVL